MDQQAHIRGHLFHNIDASCFPQAWARHRRRRQIFGRRPRLFRSHLASFAGAERGSPLLPHRAPEPRLPDGTNAGAMEINLSHSDDSTYPRVMMLHQFCKTSRVSSSSSSNTRERRREGKEGGREAGWYTHKRHPIFTQTQTDIFQRTGRYCYCYTYFS